jgi:hypothetical protein
MTDKNGASYQPRRVQRRRVKGWRMPENAVYVGRPSKWGNQFKVGDWVRLDPTLLPVQITPTVAVVLFAAKCDEVLTLPAESAQRLHLERYLKEIRGHDLACWCALDAPCHADVLLEIANA